MSQTEREELAHELSFLRTRELIRILARRLKVKMATLRQKTKDELIQELIDAGPPYA